MVFQKGNKFGNSNKGKKKLEGFGKKVSERLKKNPLRYWAGKKRPDVSEFNKKLCAEGKLGFKKGNKINYGIARNKGKHWLWKKGRKTKIYKHTTASPQYKEWRTSVFARDNFTCAICQKVGGYLEAHHIQGWTKYPKLRYEVNNGITLCLKCHKAIHNKRIK